MFRQEYGPERSGVLRGENFLLGKTTIFNPGEPVTVPIIIPPDGFPLFRHISLEKLFLTRVSLRSRLAQHGFDMEDGLAEALGAKIKLGDINWEGRVRNALSVDYPLLNRSSQPIELDEGSGLGRLFFCDWSKSLVKGESLKDLILPDKGGSLIGLEGVQGEDWIWQYGSLNEAKDENIIGVYMRLKPARKWIPPMLGGEPIKIDDKVKDYRAEV